MDIKLKEWEFMIEEGPSFENIIDARNALNTVPGKSRFKVPVNFGIVLSRKTPRTLNSDYTKLAAKDFEPSKIEFDGDSNHQFIIEGEALVDVLHIEPPYDMKKKRFKAKYNTASRQGTISFILY